LNTNKLKLLLSTLYTAMGTWNTHVLSAADH